MSLQTMSGNWDPYQKIRAYALPRAIEWLKEQGYEFKVID